MHSKIGVLREVVWHQGVAAGRRVGLLPSCTERYPKATDGCGAIQSMQCPELVNGPGVVGRGRPVRLAISAIANGATQRG